MRKKFIPLSLALCLTLSGCGGNVVLERSYSVSTPHSEVYWVPQVIQVIEETLGVQIR